MLYWLMKLESWVKADKIQECTFLFALYERFKYHQRRQEILAENEHYRVSWKTVSSNRLDEKRLKEEQPEIYEKYRKETMSRRFLIKAA